MDHPNVRSCWTKVRLDLSALDTVFMIETDLALLPDDPAYDHKAFSSFVQTIRAYLADPPINSNLADYVMAVNADVPKHEVLQRGGTRSGERYYAPGPAARRFAAASLLRPNNRAKADEILKELIQRIVAANTDPNLLMSVIEARVFGSYLDADLDAPSTSVIGHKADMARTW